MKARISKEEWGVVVCITLIKFVERVREGWFSFLIYTTKRLNVEIENQVPTYYGIWLRV